MMKEELGRIAAALESLNSKAVMVPVLLGSLLASSFMFSMWAAISVAKMLYR